MPNTKRNDFCHSIVHCLKLIIKDFEWRNKATRILKKRVIDFGIVVGEAVLSDFGIGKL